jgi:hypothetical protein
MKKLLALIPAAALAFTVASCKKEDTASTDVISVSSVYKCVIWEYSATWCNPCGVYGYDTMHYFMNKYGHEQNKAVGIFMHPSDDIVNNEPAGQDDIITFFGMSGTPSAGANLDEQYPTYLEPKIKTALIDHPTAKAGVGMQYTLSGNTMTVNTKTVFFEALTGTYQLGVYVTEDAIMNTQSGQTGEVEFNDILRVVADGKAFGTSIAVNPAKGTKVDGTYTLTLPAETRVPANCHVVCVIYKVDPATGDPTDIINANKY